MTAPPCFMNKRRNCSTGWVCRRGREMSAPARGSTARAQTLSASERSCAASGTSERSRKGHDRSVLCVVTLLDEVEHGRLSPGLTSPRCPASRPGQPCVPRTTRVDPNPRALRAGSGEGVERRSNDSGALSANGCSIRRAASASVVAEAVVPYEGRRGVKQVFSCPGRTGDSSVGRSLTSACQRA